MVTMEHLTDPHSHLDDLVRRARMLLGSGLTTQECQTHLVSSDPFPAAEDCHLAIQAAILLFPTEK